MTIKFTAQKQVIKIEYDEPPIWHISNVFYATEEKNWVHSLIQASFTIKMSALDSKGELVHSNQEVLHLPITPNHIQPVFEINQYFKLLLQPARTQRIKTYEAEFAVHNLKFKKGESITIEIMDKEYVTKRVNDWQERIHDLINQLSQWLPDAGLEVRPARKNMMHEGQMKSFDIPARELESADIFRKGKLLMTVKPFGLWILGSNGRVDLMTSTGSLILVDEANPFERPKWKVYLSHDRQKGKEFNKSVFTEIITR